MKSERSRTENYKVLLSGFFLRLKCLAAIFLPNLAARRIWTNSAVQAELLCTATCFVGRIPVDTKWAPLNCLGNFIACATLSKNHCVARFELKHPEKLNLFRMSTKPLQTAGHIVLSTREQRRAKAAMQVKFLQYESGCLSNRPCEIKT